MRERTEKLAEANQILQTEIAERELIEQILKQSEGKYSSVVKQSTESIFLIDLESRYLIEANPSFQKLLGYGRDEISGLQMYDFIAHDRDNIDQNVNIIIKNGQHFIGERKYRKKCGILVDVEVSASLIANNETRLLCVVARDITARKQAEEELEKYRHHLEELVKERTQALSMTNEKLNEELIERKRGELVLQLSKRRYELLYEENPSMYFTIDLKGRILAVNKFGAEQVGYFVADLLGKSAHLFKTQVYQLAKFLEIPAEIQQRTPTTDTYSAEQTQEEFFFRIPFHILDSIWYGWENGYETKEIATALDLTEQQVKNVIDDISRKKAATEYLRMLPL